MIFQGRTRVRYGYSRWGWTRGGGKTFHGGSDEEGLDSSAILMPGYNGKAISGKVVTARKVDKSTGNPTWEWGWYVCVQLDADQTPDAVNFLYFCHNEKNLVQVGQRVKTGDALALMGNSGNAALANPPFAHCHFEVRATATGRGLDPSAYTGHPNAVGTYGAAPSAGPARVQITGGPLNVRTGASTARPAICQVQQGDTFPVADQDAGWYFIELGAGGGWVSGDYASPVSAEGVIDGRKGA